MKAGPLRQRLRVQKPADDVVDGYTAPRKQWVDVIERDAQADSVSGREFFGADRELADITWRITMRKEPGVTFEPDWRAIDVDSGAVYDFIAILPSHHRDFLTIAARSGGAQT